jgi:propanol-preferring alcohol dehydrogenase
MSDSMRAWVAGENAGTIEMVERPRPASEDDEMLIEVKVCGICRTDLHVVDHDIPVHLPGVVPGHQAAGRVLDIGGAGRGPETRRSCGGRLAEAHLRRT